MLEESKEERLGQVNKMYGWLPLGQKLIQMTAGTLEIIFSTSLLDFVKI